MRLERRQTPSRVMAVLAPVSAVVLAALGAGILFAALGRDPVACLHTLFIAPLADGNGGSELALTATPLLLCAIGIAVGVRANVWNIGAEGQFTLGAIAGGAAALALGPAGGWHVLPLVLLAGIAGGAAWGGIAALLRTWFNAHEILVTLMLSYVALQVLGWLVRGPMQDPEGFNFPQSPMFDPAAMLPVLFEGGRVTVAALLAVLTVPLGAILLGRTVMGYRIRVVGLAPGAARYAGFSERGAVWFGGLRGGGADRAVDAVDFAGLRVCRHHRGVSRALAAGGDIVRIAADGAVVSGRRGLADHPASAAGGNGGDPGDAAAVPARGRCVHAVSPPPGAEPCAWMR